MLTIGELAKQAAVSTDTLRYYDREGLIVPRQRSQAGYRLYHEDDLRRLHFIKHAQECGFSLSEVGELLELQVSNDACCNDVRSRAVHKRQQLVHKIEALSTMSEALTGLIDICDDDTKPLDDCPILATLESAIGPSAAREPQ